MGDPRGARLSPGLAAQVAPLSAAQRAAAAGCPYALFDLRFQDDVHWRRRLRTRATGGSRMNRWSTTTRSASFALALFYAWHVASERRDSRRSSYWA